MNESSRLRIAWIGSPSHGGGVPGFCRQLLGGLIDVEIELFIFSGTKPDEFHEVMGVLGPNTKTFFFPPRWEWDRWYSRNPLAVFVSSFWARRRAYSSVVRAILAEHRNNPFDVIVQFSQTELFEMKKHLKELPPLLLFPCTHAAGELKWHRRECKLALKTESRFRHYAIRINLMHRAWVQKSCYAAVHGVIGMSRRFNELVSSDYGIESHRQAIVYQPIDLVDIPLNQSISDKDQCPVQLLFVGRIAVRKGLEMLVDLSHRIDDLSGKVKLTIVGGPSFWSDYTKVLDDLNPRIASYIGAKQHDIVKQQMNEADVLLVPSHYEPGGIVVAEALSHGCLIIASDEVGSAELLPSNVCRIFPQGDLDAFETQVRQLVTELQMNRSNLRKLASEAARDCFSPENTNASLMEILKRAAKGETIGNNQVHPQKVLDRGSSCV